MDGFEFFSFNYLGINSDRSNSGERLLFEAPTHFYEAKFPESETLQLRKTITPCISDRDISNEITKYCG